MEQQQRQAREEQFQEQQRQAREERTRKAAQDEENKIQRAEEAAQAVWKQHGYYIDNLDEQARRAAIASALNAYYRANPDGQASSTARAKAASAATSAATSGAKAKARSTAFKAMDYGSDTGTKPLSGASGEGRGAEAQEDGSPVPVPT